MTIKLVKIQLVLSSLLSACVTEPATPKLDFIIGEIRPQDCPNPTRFASEGRMAFLVDATADGKPTNIRILETWPMGVWDGFAVCYLKKRTLEKNSEGDSPPFKNHRIVMDIKIK